MSCHQRKVSLELLIDKVRCLLNPANLDHEALIRALFMLRCHYQVAKQ
jgi:hypothetical protein